LTLVFIAQHNGHVKSDMEIGVKFASLTLWTQEQVQDWRSLNDKYKTRYCRTFFLFLPDVCTYFHAVWSANGMTLLSLCPSVCPWQMCLKS